MNRKLLIVVIGVAALSGCSSAPLRVGNELPYHIQEIRDAVKYVAITDEIPEGSVITGVVSARRCQLNWTVEVPEKRVLNIDMQISTYMTGADGIAEVEYEVKGKFADPMCWKVFTATGVTYTLEGS